MISGLIEKITEAEKRSLKVRKLRINKKHICKMRVNKISVVELTNIEKIIGAKTLEKTMAIMQWMQDKPHCKDLHHIFMSFTIISDRKTLKSIRIMDTLI